jgi:plasmid stabilization system protein ParE
VADTLKWASSALDDVDDIAEFIARDSPFYAASFVQELRAAARSLQTLGGRGRVVPEVGDSSIRELFVKNYRLIYLLRPGEVTVLAVIHGARDLVDLWEKRDV